MFFRYVELGSGVGLPGIMAAAFARETTLSDYVPQVSNVYFQLFLFFSGRREFAI